MIANPAGQNPTRCFSTHRRRLSETSIKARATAELGILGGWSPPLPSAAAAGVQSKVPAGRGVWAAKWSQTVPQLIKESTAKELNLYLQTVEADPETNPWARRDQHEAHFPAVAEEILCHLCHACPVRAGVQYTGKKEIDLAMQSFYRYISQIVVMIIIMGVRPRWM